MSNEKVLVELERAEALVLFELFSRLTDDDSAGGIRKLACVNGEQGALFALVARLEECLSDEILSTDYLQGLERARLRCMEIYGV